MTASVFWLGTHPTEGSISMERYRKSLMDAVDPGDRYQPGCWPTERALPHRSGRLVKAWAKFVAYPARVSRMADIDLVHVLDQASAHLLKKVAPGVRTVVSLHDLIPLRFPNGLTPRQVDRFSKIVANLRRADAVIAVSEYSKQEAIDLLGLPEERLHVSPNGVRIPPQGVVPREMEELRKQGAEAIILSVGSAQERKNLDVLPEIFEALAPITSERVGLLRVGTRLSRPLAEKLTGVLGEGLFCEAGILEDDSLWGAYRECDAVVVPSLYEGFGLPILEAFACGKPVACSRSSSMPEVGGDEAGYFEPTEPVEAAEALARCLATRSDESARERRLRRAGEFTWRRHLEQTYEVYDSVLNGE